MFMADEQAEEVGFPALGEDAVVGRGFVADRHLACHCPYFGGQPALDRDDDGAGDGSEAGEVHGAARSDKEHVTRIKSQTSTCYLAPDIGYFAELRPKAAVRR